MPTPPPPSHCAKVSIPNAHYEFASVLFNAAAMYQWLGSNEDKSTPEGVKTAFKHFQTAAGILEQVCHGSHTCAAHEGPRSPLQGLPAGAALEGKGPRRRPQRRSDERLEEVAKAVGGGYCRLQMPLTLAFGVRGTAAGRWLGALEGAASPPSNASPLPAPTPVPQVKEKTATLTDRLPAELSIDGLAVFAQLTLTSAHHCSYLKAATEMKDKYTTLAKLAAEGAAMYENVHALMGHPAVAEIMNRQWVMFVDFYRSAEGAWALGLCGAAGTVLGGH